MKTKRWLSLLTAMAMLLGLVAVSTSAEETTDPVPDLTLAGVMSQETLEQNGHIRLTENFADNLYQAEYENADGTRTVYFFSTPVKYVTDEGEVAYIDTSLKSTGLIDRIKGYAYKTDGNAVDVYFPAKSDGKVLLEWADVSITQQICEADETGITGNVAAARSVQYAKDDAADAPAYSYQPTVTGYSGTVQFANLAAVEDVAIQLSGEDVTGLSAMGDIIGIRSGNKTVATVCGGELLDANGAFVQCAEVTAASKNGAHIVTFAFDATTIPTDVSYPLTFTYYTSADQSAWETVSATDSASARSATTATNTSCAIQDTMVNEATPNTNDSNATALVLQGGTGRACRIYTKFNLSSLSNIRYDRILSARYSIYQYYNYAYTQGAHFDIEMHQVSGSYNTSTITWNNKPAHYTQRLAGDSIIPKEEEVNGVTTVTPLAHYHFMLTSLVQGWLQGLPNNGIVLLMRDESITTSDGRRFPSSTFTNSIGPTFTVTYTTDTTSSDNIGIEDGAYYYIKCKGSVTENSTSDVGLYLTAPTTDGGFVKQQGLSSNEEIKERQMWRVESTGDGYYYLHPANDDDFSLYVMGETYYETRAGSVSGSGYDPYRKWKFIRNWDGSYHIVSLIGGDDLGIYVPSTTNNYIPFHYMTEVTMDHLDDWTLEKVSKGTASVFCFDNNALSGYDLNTRQYVESIYDPIKKKWSTAYTTAGFYGPRITASGYTLSTQINQSALVGKNKLPNSELWIYSGHGGKSGLWFATTTTSSQLLVSVDQWPGHPNKYSIDSYAKGSLSSLRYVMLQACSAGNDDIVDFGNNDTTDDVTYSLAGSLYHKGAHFVQAYTNDTNTLCGDWMQYFWSSVQVGATIEAAIEYADEQLLEHHFGNSLPYNDLMAVLCNRHILGDTAMCLNPQP